MYFVRPVLDCGTGDRDFERQNDSPLKDVVPSHGESEGGVEHTGSESVETTRNGEDNSHFTKSLGDIDQHDTHDDPGEKNTSGSTLGKSRSGTDEESSTDGTTNGDHLQVAGPHLLLEKRVVVRHKLLRDVTVGNKTAISQLLLFLRK